MREDIETFFGPDPLGEPFSKEFSRTCAEPIPRAPQCDEACDPATLIQEMKAIENFIRLHHLDGRSIDEDGYTVMKPPKSRKSLLLLLGLD